MLFIINYSFDDCRSRAAALIRALGANNYVRKFMNDTNLIDLLTINGFHKDYARDVAESGYFLHPFYDPGSGKPFTAVMDGRANASKNLSP